MHDSPAPTPTATARPTGSAPHRHLPFSRAENTAPRANAAPPRAPARLAIRRHTRAPHRRAHRAHETPAHASMRRRPVSKAPARQTPLPLPLPPSPAAYVRRLAYLALFFPLQTPSIILSSDVTALRLFKLVQSGREVAVYILRTSSCRTAPTTSFQRPAAGCRNRRALGYHGLSLRSRNQRHSPSCGRRIHTGRFNDPAR